jgi:uncharacterized protein (DUF1697 family)
MSTYIALLRGINLAGHKPVRMADLRAFLTDLGFADPRTLLASGNAVFDDARRNASTLESLLEAEAADRLGLETEFFVRKPRQWDEVIAGNPFEEQAERDPRRLLVMALKRKPAAQAVRRLQDSIGGPETVRPGARHLYVVYPDGIGRSKLTVARIEKMLGTRGTGRNWNTVLKLRDLVRDR